MKKVKNLDGTVDNFEETIDKDGNKVFKKVKQILNADGTIETIEETTDKDGNKV